MVLESVYVGMHVCQVEEHSSERVVCTRPNLATRWDYSTSLPYRAAPTTF